MSLSCGLCGSLAVVDLNASAGLWICELCGLIQTRTVPLFNEPPAGPTVTVKPLGRYLLCQPARRSAVLGPAAAIRNPARIIPHRLSAGHSALAGAPCRPAGRGREPASCAAIRSASSPIPAAQSRRPRSTTATPGPMPIGTCAAYALAATSNGHKRRRRPQPAEPEARPARRCSRR